MRCGARSLAHHAEQQVEAAVDATLRVICPAARG
jgi:hypothetical protein